MPEVRDVATAPEPRRAALGRLLEDAPADLHRAVIAHRAHRRGRHGGLLGRLTCPRVGLDALAAELGAEPEAGIEAWIIGVSVERTRDWVEAAAAAGKGVAAFSRRVGAVVDVLEVPIPSVVAADRRRLAGEVAGVLQSLETAGRLTPFFEIPWSRIPMMTATLEGIAATRSDWRRNLGVSLRADGREGPPGHHHLATFIDGCRRWSLPMRVVGLESTVTRRGSDGPHHGVLNVVAAAALSCERAAPVAALERVLCEDRRSEFSIGSQHLSWAGVVVPWTAIADARRKLLTAIAVKAFDSIATDLSSE